MILPLQPTKQLLYAANNDTSLITRIILVRQDKGAIIVLIVLSLEWWVQSNPGITPPWVKSDEMGVCNVTWEFVMCNASRLISGRPPGRYTSPLHYPMHNFIMQHAHLDYLALVMTFTGKFGTFVLKFEARDAISSTP